MLESDNKIWVTHWRRNFTLLGDLEAIIINELYNHQKVDALFYLTDDALNTKRKFQVQAAKPFQDSMLGVLNI